jgi:hypothetical protein
MRQIPDSQLAAIEAELNDRVEGLRCVLSSDAKQILTDLYRSSVTRGPGKMTDELPRSRARSECNDVVRPMFGPAVPGGIRPA